MTSRDQIEIPVNYSGNRQSQLPWLRVADKVGDIIRHRINMKLQSENLSCDSTVPWIDSIDESLVEEEHIVACKLLGKRLEGSLREARLKSILRGEVLLPSELTQKIASDVFKMAEVEPCGLKGCVIYILLEEQSSCRRIGKVSCDPHTVSTFELFLTLRQDSANNWLSLRNLMRRLGRTSPLVISEDYNISKRKLYRSSSLED